MPRLRKDATMPALPRVADYPRMRGEMRRDLKAIKKKWSDRINKWIYCPHCREMEYATLLGRDSQHRNIFRCGKIYCRKEIQVVPAT